MCGNLVSSALSILVFKESRFSGATIPPSVVPFASNLFVAPAAIDVASVSASSPPLVGTYECHKYDGTKNKNDWHYVTIKAEGSQLRWSNRAGVSRMLTPRADGNLDVGKECPYYKNVTVL